MDQKKFKDNARILAAAAVDLGGLVLGIACVATVGEALKPVKTTLPKPIQAFAKATLMAIAAAVVTIPSTVAAWKLAIVDENDRENPGSDWVNSVKSWADKTVKIRE